MQKGFAPIIILVGIVVLAGVAGGAYYFGKSQAPKPQLPNPVVTSQASQVTPSMQSTVFPPEKYVKEIQLQLGTHEEIASESSRLWVETTGEYEWLKGFEFALTISTYNTAERSFGDKYGVIASSDMFIGSTISPTVSETFIKLKDASERYFATNGFKVNEKNSKQDLRNNYAYIERSYEKDDIKCVTSLVSAYTFAHFFCGAVDDEANMLSKEFSPAINPTHDPETIVSVGKVAGDFAVGSVNQIEGGGSVWFAQKVQGKWKKIFGGQNPPTCDSISQYKMPKELSNCLDF